MKLMTLAEQVAHTQAAHGEIHTSVSTMLGLTEEQTGVLFSLGGSNVCVRIDDEVFSECVATPGETTDEAFEELGLVMWVEALVAPLGATG